jgi:hypothetical protein
MLFRLICADSATSFSVCIRVGADQFCATALTLFFGWTALATLAAAAAAALAAAGQQAHAFPISASHTSHPGQPI